MSAEKVVKLRGELHPVGPPPTTSTDSILRCSSLRDPEAGRGLEQVRELAPNVDGVIHLLGRLGVFADARGAEGVRRSPHRDDELVVRDGKLRVRRGDLDRPLHRTVRATGSTAIAPPGRRRLRAFREERAHGLDERARLDGSHGRRPAGAGC